MTVTDIRTLDFNLLKTLDALLDERNVTRAAARLSLTQPAVSGMLTRLRESFGDPLFVRTPRGIVPTVRALALAGPVKRVLADIDAMMQPAGFDPANASATLSIAATDYAIRAIVVPLAAVLRGEAPGIRIALRPIDDTRIANQLERGELDLALTTPDEALPDLHARQLFDEDYVCAMRAAHPDAAGGRAGDVLPLNRFCALDHALVSYAGGAFSGATDTALAALGRARHVAVSAPGFLTLLDLLRATDLIAVLPRRLVRADDGLTLREPPLPIPGFTKIAVWHERTHRDPALRWLRERLFAVSDALSPVNSPGPASATAAG